MEKFAIHDLAVGNGRLGLCPVPGGSGTYRRDLARLRRWHPDLVLSMVKPDELRRAGASGLGADLGAAGIGWQVLALPDFGVPDAAVRAQWPAVSARARAILAQGGKVLVHCRGGCGRSGMAALRLMVEIGEAPDAALARLRHSRPCAVETAAQRLWAMGGA